MSDKTLIELVQELVDGMKAIVDNQQKFSAEQDRLKMAMGEFGIGLLDHTRTLRNLGAATVRLWQEADLPLDEQPEVPPGAVN